MVDLDLLNKEIFENNNKKIKYKNTKDKDEEDDSKEIRFDESCFSNISNEKTKKKAPVYCWFIFNLDVCFSGFKDDTEWDLTLLKVTQINKRIWQKRLNVCPTQLLLNVERTILIQK